MHTDAVRFELVVCKLAFDWRPDISEAKILAAADQFVSLGLKDAGYTYVNIDVGQTQSLHIYSLTTSANRIAGQIIHAT